MGKGRGSPSIFLGRFTNAVSQPCPDLMMYNLCGLDMGIYIKTNKTLWDSLGNYWNNKESICFALGPGFKSQLRTLLVLYL